MNKFFFSPHSQLATTQARGDSQVFLRHERRRSKHGFSSSLNLQSSNNIHKDFFFATRVVLTYLNTSEIFDRDQKNEAKQHSVEIFDKRQRKNQ